MHNQGSKGLCSERPIATVPAGTPGCAEQSLEADAQKLRQREHRTAHHVPTQHRDAHHSSIPMPGYPHKQEIAYHIVQQLKMEAWNMGDFQGYVLRSVVLMMDKYGGGFLYFFPLNNILCLCLLATGSLEVC